MPDTEAEKQTGLNDCHKCKYKDECELLKEWIEQAIKSNLYCKLGVK